MTTHPIDRQSEAYRHATEADWAGVDLTECAVYRDDDPEPIRTPEDHEQAEWDANRKNPKTVEEARRALAARIADPAAPDDESVASAYDEEG
jgi:hypothetical protein